MRSSNSEPRMSLVGHLRRGHVDGMSAIAPIATELLREGNGRKGPRRDSCAAQISRRIMVPTSMALTCGGGAVRSMNSGHRQFSFSAARR